MSRQVKLTAAQRAELARRAKAGEGQTALAREFGVSGTYVWRLRNGYEPSDAKAKGAKRRVPWPSARLPILGNGPVGALELFQCEPMSRDGYRAQLTPKACAARWDKARREGHFSTVGVCRGCAVGKRNFEAAKPAPEAAPGIQGGA